MDLYGSLWTFMELMNLHRPLQTFMDLYGSLKTLMDLYGPFLTLLDLNGSLWTIMDLYELRETKITLFLGGPVPPLYEDFLGVCACVSTLLCLRKLFNCLIELERVNC